SGNRRAAIVDDLTAESRGCRAGRGRGARVARRRGLAEEQTGEESGDDHSRSRATRLTVTGSPVRTVARVAIVASSAACCAEGDPRKSGRGRPEASPGARLSHTDA